MANLTIVANIFARENQIDFVKEELLKLIAPTRAEEGCLQYDLHQDHQDPGHFLFYETWLTRDLWQAHMDNPQLHRFMEVTKDALENFTLHEMTKIE
ncbi:putative quinol monooxygenase [Parendozoicomonas haliclonae]|uniref:Antibiotic biosynthesis monooxygenase n=1 Tax=Parendozoicomonas haliclonae TaxID=1960125 RepID=A0A1X7AQW1_9GAMM|nr:putative quinol monooxygenase [Parendozoicomonas haliclonae]SMA50625.1 Antibiotic biosynthesis monooxygenase [Parendozoicomonas haliclonae]